MPRSRYGAWGQASKVGKGCRDCGSTCVIPGCRVCNGTMLCNHCDSVSYVLVVAGEAEAGRVMAKAELEIKRRW
jgi:hypothetical protein